MCQKPGRFLRLSRAKMRARMRQAYFEAFGPTYLAMKFCTDVSLVIPNTAADTVTMPATGRRRVTADMAAWGEGGIYRICWLKNGLSG